MTNEKEQKILQLNRQLLNKMQEKLNSPKLKQDSGTKNYLGRNQRSNLKNNTT